MLLATSVYLITDHLTSPVRIAVGNIRSDSHIFFSLSDAFFISSSSCLLFSPWALVNILVKLSKVETTEGKINKKKRITRKILYNTTQFKKKKKKKSTYDFFP